RRRGTCFERRTPTLCAAEGHIVAQRIDTGVGNIWVLCEIKGRVELRMRIAPLLPAGSQVVPQRVHAGLGHIRVVLQIERGVEQAVRITTFLPARGGIVLGGIQVLGSYVWIGR